MLVQVIPLYPPVVYEVSRPMALSIIRETLDTMAHELRHNATLPHEWREAAYADLLRQLTQLAIANGPE